MHKTFLYSTVAEKRDIVYAVTDYMNRLFGDGLNQTVSKIWFDFSYEEEKYYTIYVYTRRNLSKTKETLFSSMAMAYCRGYLKAQTDAEFSRLLAK